MTTKSSHILVFALAFSFFILAPPFLGQPFPAYPLIHWADVLDHATPLVLIPLYWILFTAAGGASPSYPRTLWFLALSALWTLGQGMHLSANSISNLLGSGSSDLHDLIHFYDEVLSHYLWHFGIIGLSVLLVSSAEETETERDSPAWSYILPSAILYGFTYFAAVNEGGTVPLGLPAAALIALGIFARGRSRLLSQPLALFFFVGYLASLLLLAGWFVYWGGFPEFTETGLL